MGRRRVRPRPAWSADRALDALNAAAGVAGARAPGNLSRRAVADILRRSEKEWGVAVARQTRERLLLRFGQIADGSAVGHQRHGVKPRTPTLFLRETPWVIAYDPEKRQVLRILYGTWDFPAVFPPRS